MRVRKGPYYADDGDFATAGALRLDLVDRAGTPFVQGTVGSFGYWRGLAAGSRRLGAGHAARGRRGRDLRRSLAAPATTCAG